MGIELGASGMQDQPEPSRSNELFEHNNPHGTREHTSWLKVSSAPLLILMVPVANNWVYYVCS